MATGWTTTGSLDNSLDNVRSSARIIREDEGVMPQLVDKKTLGVGIGLSWQELTYSQLAAQAITETTELDNPQQMADALLTVTPTVVGIETFLTDRVQARISKLGYDQIGKLGQNAIQRKKDEDGLTVLGTGATTAEPGAGATMTSSYLSAAKYRISSNTVEPGNPPFYWVAHGYQLKDIHDEIVASIGTAAIPEGLTARVFREGFNLMTVAGVTAHEDGNIAIDSSDDAVGGVFSKEAIVFVQGVAPRIISVRNEKRGGGGTHVYHYDEYAYGERPGGNTAGTWLYRMKSDALAPTS